MRFSNTVYAVVSFLVVGLSVGLGMPFSTTAYAIAGFRVIGLLVGLQSSMRFPSAMYQLSISWSLAIGQSIIIQGMRLSSFVYAIVSFPVVGLSDSPQSFRRYISPVLRMPLSVSE